MKSLPEQGTAALYYRICAMIDKVPAIRIFAAPGV